MPSALGIGAHRRCLKITGDYPYSETLNDQSVNAAYLGHRPDAWRLKAEVLVLLTLHILAARRRRAFVTVHRDTRPVLARKSPVPVVIPAKAGIQKGKRSATRA